MQMIIAFRLNSHLYYHVWDQGEAFEMTFKNHLKYNEFCMTINNLNTNCILHVIQNMCFLMQQPRLCKRFSYLQKLDPAIMKNLYINNTAHTDMVTDVLIMQMIL